MCGIAGCLTLGTQSDNSRDVIARTVRGMADTMVARGPDSAGVWTDAEAGIGLGFRRLAIVDLSFAGHQPMVSGNQRYVITFNGEIYNHRELRAQLETARPCPDAFDQNLPGDSRAFRGASDTEVLLAGIEEWGLDETLRKVVGMFAFALWDRRDRTLCLARDRMGEKPLYYGLTAKQLLFGSEIKALRAHPDFAASINRDALQLYIRHGWIPSPHSIYEGIFKLPPGCKLVFSQADKQARQLPAPRPYWTVQQAAIGGQTDPLIASDTDARRQLDHLLNESVAQQMVADVPLGAFLSGGIDSSTVVAIMQSISHRPVKTFSIGFHESEFNEAHYARQVAEHLGTDHCELYVSPAEAREVIPKLPEIYDEPFADSSQIPTFLVSQLARQHVTVSLSGDGGDELFSGYTRYRQSELAWWGVRMIPTSLRTSIGRFFKDSGAAATSRISSHGVSAGHRSGRVMSRFNHRARRAAQIFGQASFQELYRGMLSVCEDSADCVPGGREAYSVLSDRQAAQGIHPLGRQMRFYDQMSYLPDDILAKVDRATMAVSLESRMPLLDHRIVEFAWRLPNHQLRRHGKSKWLLREVLYQYLPKALVERPKMGFAIPIRHWLLGPLRDWAEDLLSESRLRNDGYLQPAIVRRRWHEHTSGTRNWGQHLWTLLMFQAWREHASGKVQVTSRAA